MRHGPSPRPARACFSVAGAPRAAVALAAVLAVAVVAGCVGPARTGTDYRLKARSSARSAQSAVATARLGARLVSEKKAFANYLAVVFDGAENDANSVESTFSSIQPPDRASDRLRDRLGTVLHDAADTISQMRVAARRHDWSSVLDAAKNLPRLERQLSHYAEMEA